MTDKAPLRTENADAVVEVRPGLYAIGGALRAKSPVTWIPAGARGWMPIQCYLFQGRDRSLIMDTGLPVHRAQLKAGISRLRGDCSELELLVSRWELESMVNLPWLTDTFGIHTVYGVGELDPLEFFSAFDNANNAAQLHAMRTRATLSPLAPGDVLKVGDFEIECLRTTLRLLLTNWFYEKRTRSLFSADSWSFMTHPRKQGPFVTRPSAERVSVDRVLNGYRGKFYWLSGAKSGPLIEDLQELRRTRVIDRICPNYGGIIEGRAACARLIDNTIEALRVFGREKRKSVYEGIDWAHALSEDAVIRVEDAPRPNPY